MGRRPRFDSVFDHTEGEKKKGRLAKRRGLKKDYLGGPTIRGEDRKEKK